MPEKNLTDNQIRELILGVDVLDEEERNRYIDMLKTLTEEQKQRFAAIFQRATNKLKEIDEEYKPKLMELYKQKIEKIKEFIKKVLPKFRKKQEKAEVEAEEKEGEELLKQLDNL